MADVRTIHRNILKGMESPDPQLQQRAQTAMVALQKDYPGSFYNGQLRPSQDEFNRQMEQYSAGQQVGEMDFTDRMLTSAGIGANRMVTGLQNLVGFGDEQQQVNETQQQQYAQQAIEEQDPVAGVLSNAVGSSIPGMAVPFIGAGPTAASFIPRAIGSMVAGGAEGGTIMPLEGETRQGNAAQGAAFGLVSEGLLTGLTKYIRSKKSGMLDEDSGNIGNVEDALREQGVELTDLKPETQQVLAGFKVDDDVDAAVREALATEYGFSLTKGQSMAPGEDAFIQQSAEATASRMSNEAGTNMRAFRNEQNADIKKAGGVLAEGLGGRPIKDQSGNELADQTSGMGGVIKDALLKAKEEGQDSYNAAYAVAKELSNKSGSNLQFPSSDLAETYLQLVRQYSGSERGMLTDLGNMLVERGVLDPQMLPGDILLQRTGQQLDALSYGNAEEVRKYINKFYNANSTQSKEIVKELKKSLDGAQDAHIDALGQVDDSVLNAAGVSRSQIDDLVSAAQEARGKYSEFQGLWESRDILRDITRTKALDDDTPFMDPSKVVAKVTNSPEDLGRVMERLNATGNQQAIDDLRTFYVKNLLDNAVNANNLNSANDEIFSAAKFSTSFREKKTQSILQTLLTPEQFETITKFERQVSRTKPIEGTVNNSGTAYKLMDLVFNLTGLRHVPIVNFVPEAAARGTVKNATSKVVRNDEMPVTAHANINAVLRAGMYQGEDRLTNSGGALEE
jgi:hypothetical protein